MRQSLGANPGYDIMNISLQRDISDAEGFEMLKRREVKDLELIFAIKNNMHQ